jgi:hypothetical protein
LPTEKLGDADLQPAQCLQQRGFSPLVRNDADWPIARLLLTPQIDSTEERHIHALALKHGSWIDGQCKRFYGRKTFDPKGRKSTVGPKDIKPPIPEGLRPP